MESVSHFDIELDLNHVERLYDYGNRKELKRPLSGEWDPANLTRELDCADENDEASMLRVVLMDRAVTDKKFFEKQYDKGDSTDKPSAQSWQHFGYLDETKHLPPRVFAVFKPGDIVRGTVVMVLKDDNLKADKLTLRFKGGAKVNLRTYSHQGYPYDNKSSEVFVEETLTLWEKSSEDKTKGDQFSLISPSEQGYSPKSGPLPPGEHRFPFEFAIPHDARASTPDLVASTVNYAYIVYRLKAMLDTGTLSRNIITFRGIWLEKEEDIAQEPERLQPVTVEERMDTSGIRFWKKGVNIWAKVTLPRSAFVRNEKVPVAIEICNQSGGAIDAIKAQVLLGGKYYLGKKKPRIPVSIKCKSEKVKAEAILDGASSTFNWEIPLDFAPASVDSNLIPVGNLEDCLLIDVKYTLLVTLKRKGLHRNLTMQVPLHIGNTNSKVVPETEA